MEYNINITMSKTIYSKDQQQIIIRLRKARLEAGLDQKQIAQLIGKTQSHISKVESGQRRIDVVELKEFSRLYKKPMDYFLK